MGLQASVQESQQLVEDQLIKSLSQIGSEIAPRLHQAISYSLLNGGKRVRPFLVFAVAEMIGLDKQLVAPAAASLEMIHSYSLVHDDLPAMDNDELRRGKPTCHIQFDEAHAILAGDALQPLAFAYLMQASVSADIKVRWVELLSDSAGYKGMCGGQSLDLLAEDEQVSLSELENIHRLKTGALLSCAVQLACVAKPDLPAQHQQAIANFAKNIGLAFQVRDDILDITSTTEQLGKPQGSDAKLLKSTYPSLLGLEQAQQKADDLYDAAIAALDSLPYCTALLKEFAAYIVNRNH
ncbi:geranyl transferase [Saccharobesus litoralis]|uniref:Geranyl transferase n=1 Tax=Saccharobesus litoralis TaxID=2172099 RepID=A0A2S0VLL7_9ALTE|nr:geranyl transferase [Saccharobesus litoralis]